MSSLHSDLLFHYSIQQTKKGRLPAGLLKEINDAGNLASFLFQQIDRRQILALDKIDLSADSSPLVSIACEFSRQGLYSKWLPAFAGGGGGHPLAFFGLNMEMGAHCLGLSNLLGAHYVALGLVSATQSFSILKKIITEIKLAESKGELCSAALAITEPSAGSDMEDVELIKKASVITKAEKVKGGYRITGQKIFISNSSFSSWLIGSAFTDCKDPQRSLIIFAIRTKTEGVSLGRIEKKLGQNASPASVLFFDNVFVSDADICFSREHFEHEEDYLKNGELLLNDLLSLSRAGVGCLATAAQKRILEIVLQKTKADQDFEWMQAKIALLVQNFVVSKTVAWEGHVECYSRGPYRDLQRPLVYKLLKSLPIPLQMIFPGRLLCSPFVRKSLRDDRRKKLTTANEKMIFGWGSLVKGYCSDRAMESARIALELIGHEKSDEGLELEKILRDLKLLQIYEGTNELNLLMCFKNFTGDKNTSQEIFREKINA
jgi:alkylation response protein AidB-like acyl-CoA dehydrogenase